MIDDRLERVRSRLNTNEEFVQQLIGRVDVVTTLAVIEYIEKRLNATHGDESVKYELGQIRLDLAALATGKTLDKTHEKD